MDVNVLRGLIQEREADAAIVGLLEGLQPEGAAAALDSALGGALKELVEGGDFTGKAGQVAVLYPRGAVPARRVIAVGLGKPEVLSADQVRRAAAVAARKARDLKAARAATVLHGLGNPGLDAQVAAQAVVEGTLLGLYTFQGYKKAETAATFPTSLDVLVSTDDDLAAAQRGLDAARALAAGVRLTRDLVNTPPNFCTPAYMAETAVRVAEEVGLRVQVLEKGQMEALNMGALLGVARGSDAPPRFIILEHNSARADELDSVVLIGKGVTFDTGGYNIKSSQGMDSMKGDMAGAAAVLGAMRAIAALDIPLHVVGLMPAADNMISGHAYRPQEVVTASNGVTIEIISTDAEGRMLLADALVFAKRFSPAAVVDIATLTGACHTALGGVAAGLFSTDDHLRDTLIAAGKATAEKVWPMPLFPEYEKSIESEVADIKNSGGAGSGVGSSATFLKHFVDFPAWAHLDMAGMEFEAKDVPYAPGKGATGYGVRLLTEFVRRWAAKED